MTKKRKYTKKFYNEIVEASIQAIEEYNILFLPDVAAYLPISRTEFYEMEIDLNNRVQDAVEKRRSLVKQSLTAKWMKSDSPTLSIALYKLISSPQERLAMTGKSDLSGDRDNTQKAYLESLESMGEDDVSD